MQTRIKVSLKFYLKLIDLPVSLQYVIQWTKKFATSRWRTQDSKRNCAISLRLSRECVSSFISRLPRWLFYDWVIGRLRSRPRQEVSLNSCGVSFYRVSLTFSEEISGFFSGLVNDSCSTFRSNDLHNKNIGSTILERSCYLSYLPFRNRPSN